MGLWPTTVHEKAWIPAGVYPVGPAVAGRQRGGNDHVGGRRRPGMTTWGDAVGRGCHPRDGSTFAHGPERQSKGSGGPLLEPNCQVFNGPLGHFHGSEESAFPRLTVRLR